MFGFRVAPRQLLGIRKGVEYDASQRRVVHRVASQALRLPLRETSRRWGLMNAHNSQVLSG